MDRSKIWLQVWHGTTMPFTQEPGGSPLARFTGAGTCSAGRLCCSSTCLVAATPYACMSGVCLGRLLNRETVTAELSPGHSRRPAAQSWHQRLPLLLVASSPVCVSHCTWAGRQKDTRAVRVAGIFMQCCHVVSTARSWCALCHVSYSCRGMKSCAQ